MKRPCNISIVIATAAALGVSLVSPRLSLSTNGHQLSAIGAYQQGMAGAVTAAPYDASTAITNPAGMALIGNRTDFSFEAFFPRREISFANAETSLSGSRFYLVPAMGWTAPANRLGDVYFGGGMYGVSGMGVDYTISSVPFLEAGQGGPFDDGSAAADIFSQYQFWKMAPSLAFKSGSLAFGIALNLDYQAFGFKTMFSGTMGGTQAKIGMDLSEIQSAVGAGATIGFLYQPVPAFAMGASYASRQFFTDFTWRLASGDISNVADKDGAIVSSTDGQYSMNLDFPQQAAIGIAVRPFRKLLWTADVKWINYRETYSVVTLTGNFTGGAKEVPLNFGWDDVMVYASALQVDITPSLVFRMGGNFSSSPIKPEDVDNNVAFPAIVRKHASAGVTYRFGRFWEMTLGYMKAFREEMKSNSGTGTLIMLEESAADVQLSYRF